MPDHLTPEQRSRAMKRVKLKNGSIEKAVQLEFKKRGLAFRRHVRSLPGSPDIVFHREKVAVFVDGNFWHGWRLPAWEHKLTPFWRDKLQTNRARDQRNFRRLRAAGWVVIRLWQHDVKERLQDSIQRVIYHLQSRTISCPGCDIHVPRTSPQPKVVAPPRTARK
jgi:DNA mismatch endonuclease, patch repair protein